MTTGEFEEVTLPGVNEGEILVIRSARRKKVSPLTAKVGESLSQFLLDSVKLMSEP